jgi:hypothetical protein
MRDRDREDKCNADFILHDAVFLKKRAYVSLSLSLSRRSVPDDSASRICRR